MTGTNTCPDIQINRKADKMFESKDGFLHVCVAPHNMYDHGCTAYLSRRRAIYYKLCEMGYQGIWFGTADEKGIKIEAEDERSANAAGSWLKRRRVPFLWSKQPQPEQIKRPEDRYPFLNFHKNAAGMIEFCESITGSETEKNAIVCSPDFFAEMDVDDTGRNRLLQNLKGENNRSIIVIVLDTEDYFSGEKLAGLYHTFAAGYSRKLADIIENAPTGDLFHILSSVLGSSFSVIDPFGRDQLLSMLKKGMLHKNYPVSPEECDELSAFLYLWMHASGFRKEYSAGLKYDSYTDIRTLSEDLTINENLKKLLADSRLFYINTENGVLSKEQYSFYGMPERVRPENTGNDLVRRMDSVRAEDLFSSDDKKRIHFLTGFRRLRNQAAIVRIKRPLYLKRLEEYQNLLEITLKNGAGGKAADALSDLYDLAEEQGEEAVQKRKILVLIVQYANEIEKLKKTVKSVNEKLPEKREKLKVLLDELAEKSREKHEGAEALSLTSQKDRAISLKKEIDTESMLAAGWQIQIGKLVDGITSLSLYLEKKQGDISNFDANEAEEVLRLLERTGDSYESS